MIRKLHLPQFLVIGALVIAISAGSLGLSIDRAQAADDQTQEVGALGISDYGDLPGFGDIQGAEDADGFTDGVADATSYDTKDLRQNDNCKEVHLKDARFGGNDQYSFDKSDILYFAGHGDWDNLWFNTTESAHNLGEANARWGDTDADWVMVGACYLAGNNGFQYLLENDLTALCGLHAWFGYCCAMDDVGYTHGYQLGSTLGALSFKTAWSTVEDVFQTEGKTLRMFYGEGCEIEYVSSIGPYHQGDPTPYENGGAVYVETWGDMR